jgi:hypothetical protein
MRILIAGPPKTGNVWVENILAMVYGLKILQPPNVPGSGPGELQDFIDRDLFKDGSIFHQHFMPTRELFQAAASVRCHLVTTIRNPYDTFVSLYHYIQRFSEDFIRCNDVGQLVIGKPIDHPDALAFLRHGFTWNLIIAREWLRSNRSIIVRYEDLHADTFKEVKRMTDQIEAVDEGLIRQVIAATAAPILRKKDKSLAKHIRTAVVGDWQNHLNEKHLRIFRTCHAQLIRETGYEVEESPTIRAKELACRALPPDSIVLVISKGDEELLGLGGRTCWHFPRAPSGEYAGYYPADGAEAVSHLESLRARGAEFLLIPNTAFWWLEYYEAFRKHLEDHYRLAVRQEGACLVFDLRE